MTEQTLRTAMAEYGDTVYRLALCRTLSLVGKRTTQHNTTSIQ